MTVLGGGLPAGDIRGAFPPDVRDRVWVVDRSSEADVMAAYRRHDVLAWPSTYEGFGMVLLEAMSQRLPVVATPVGCASALVHSERTGLVVSPRDAAALARGLGRMLDDPAFAQTMRGRCLRDGPAVHLVPDRGQHARCLHTCSHRSEPWPSSLS